MTRTALIAFSKAGVGKIGGRKREEFTRAVALPANLKHGKLVNTEDDLKVRPDVKA